MIFSTTVEFGKKLSEINYTSVNLIKKYIFFDYDQI